MDRIIATEKNSVLKNVVSVWSHLKACKEAQVLKQKGFHKIDV